MAIWVRWKGESYPWRTHQSGSGVGLGPRGLEAEGCLHTGAHHDVRVAVQKLDKLFQTPEAALEAAHDAAGHRVLGSWGPEAWARTLVLKASPRGPSCSAALGSPLTL